jgi:hypothetical protein
MKVSGPCWRLGLLRLVTGNVSRPIGRLTQEQAAEMLNVGERTVRRAREVLNEGVPEVISAVERGAVSVSAAANVARLPEPKQREIISTGTKPVTAAVRDIRTADQAPKMESRLKRVPSGSCRANTFDANAGAFGA